MKATLLVAPGGTGNHMWNEILETAGSLRIGDNEFGDMVHEGPPRNPVVHWFRSMPNRLHKYESLFDMIRTLQGWGYTIRAIVPVRDWYCMARSQMRRHGVISQEQVWKNSRAGYNFITTAYQQMSIEYMLASYEAAVSNPEYIRFVLRRLRLPHSSLPEVRDENRKWY